MVLRLKIAVSCTVPALIGVLSSCDAITAPENGDTPLQSDRAVYQLQSDGHGNLRVEIPFTYHNGTGKTVYLVNCGGAVPPSLQKWENGKWVMAWRPSVDLCSSPPIEVAPDGVHEDTLQVFSAGPESNAAPKFLVAQPDGIYRLIWPEDVALHDYNFNTSSGRPLALRNRISNSFELRSP